MSLEAWGDQPDDGMCTEERVEEAFRDGARHCREYMARFVEQGGHPEIAASIRANWMPANGGHSGWGNDPGPVEGDIWLDPWGMAAELLERSRERTRQAWIAAGGEE